MILKLGKREKVNLIIKDHVIRYLEARPGDLASVKSIGEVYIPDGIIQEGRILDKNRLRRILEECIKRWGIKHQEILLTVPDSSVVVRTLQVPSEIDDREIKGYLYMELGSTIHLPIENPVFDYLVLGQKEGKKEILLYAAPENIVHDYSNLLDEVKLEPVVVDLSPLAIYRLYHRVSPAEVSDHVLSVQFDLQTVTVSIFKEHKLIFMRHVKMNVDRKLWETQMDMDGLDYLVWCGDESHLWSEVQEMVEEIEKVMSFYHFNLTQGKDQITQIVLTGDHPHLVDIFKRMQSTTETPIHLLNEQDFRTQKGSSIPNRHYLNLGLSLKEVQ